MRYTLHNSDNLSVLKSLPDNSVDGIITDPPYGISFMNNRWDYDVPPLEVWEECLRVLKPGGTLLSFGGSRTFHRIAVGIEDADFLPKDTILWLYGQGFPKAQDMNKLLLRSFETGNLPSEADIDSLLAAFEGYKTHQLKPAYEPIIMAIKPLDGGYAVNAAKWGVGGLNIEAAKIPSAPYMVNKLVGWSGFGQEKRPEYEPVQTSGRYPANVILDEEAGRLLDEQGGERRSGSGAVRSQDAAFFDNSWGHAGEEQISHNDSGGASRFFYCAKVKKSDREIPGLGLPELSYSDDGKGGDGETPYQRKLTGKAQNHHPTVKPLDLMRYLCTLIKVPAGGVILDPYMGSGTTGVAAIMTAQKFIGIEKHGPYYQIAEARISRTQPGLL